MGKHNRVLVSILETPKGHDFDVAVTLGRPAPSSTELFQTLVLIFVPHVTVHSQNSIFGHVGYVTEELVEFLELASRQRISVNQRKVGLIAVDGVVCCKNVTLTVLESAIIAEVWVGIIAVLFFFFLLFAVPLVGDSVDLGLLRWRVLLLAGWLV